MFIPLKLVGRRIWNIVLSSVSLLRQALEKCLQSYLLSVPITSFPGMSKLHITFGIPNWWVQNDTCATRYVILQLTIPFHLHTATLWGTNIVQGCFTLFFCMKKHDDDQPVWLSAQTCLWIFSAADHQKIGPKRICREAKQFISLPNPWYLLPNSCNLWQKFTTAPPISAESGICCKKFLFIGLVVYTFFYFAWKTG